MTRLEHTVLTRERFVTQARGVRLFELLDQYLPELAPRRWGPWEPCRERYEDGGAERIVAHPDWGRHTMLWRGRGKGVEGSVTPRTFDFDLLGAVNISGVPLDTDVEALVQLFIVMSVEFEAEFGALHVLSAADRERGFAGGYVARETRDRPDSDFLLITPRTLTKFVPDLFWCTALGPLYVELFGRSALQELDACEARFVKDDLFFMRLSDDPIWVVQNPEQLEAKRSCLKRDLRPDAFFCAERGVEGSYAVPVFASPSGTERREEHAPRPSAAVNPGQELVDPDGDRWIVKRVEGDVAALRRVKDDLPFDVGSLSSLLEAGAFQLAGPDPVVADAEKVKARRARRGKKPPR